ncbi:MAG: site-specific integrase [Euryarchaeota archaeon]|nr:site-specific integrase [Euryarchaeota archaeon]
MGRKNGEVYKPWGDTEPKILQLLDDNTLPPETRSHLAHHSNSLKDKGCVYSHRHKEIYRAHRFLTWWKKTKTPTLDDVNRFLGGLRSQGHKEKDIAHFAGSIKRYYTRANKGIPPEALRLLSTTPREKRKNRPHWTQEDVEKMITAADHPQNRAIIMAHIESGARPEEFLKLSIGDFTFAPDHSHAKVNLPTGKTGQYTQTWVRTIPYLLLWFRHHPGPKKPDGTLDPAAPLWVSRTPRARGQRLSYSGLYHILQDVGKAAGIPPEKRNPYSARRGNATWLLSQGWTKEKVNMWQGRLPGSRLIDIYSQDFDLSQEMLRMTGLLTGNEEKDKPDRLRPIKCEWCGHMNEAVPPPKVCQCGKPLSIEAAQEFEEKSQARIKKLEDQVAEYQHLNLTVLKGMEELKSMFLKDAIEARAFELLQEQMVEGKLDPLAFKLVMAQVMEGKLVQKAEAKAVPAVKGS